MIPVNLPPKMGGKRGGNCLGDELGDRASIYGSIVTMKVAQIETKSVESRMAFFFFLFCHDSLQYYK